MSEPINIRVTSVGPRITGGAENILIEGTYVKGGKRAFLFEMNRARLAETLARDARQGLAVDGTLHDIERELADPERVEVEVEKPNAVYL